MTIINILSVIASRANDTGSAGSSFTIPPVSDPYQVHFVPEAAAVRFNILFFSSLVLSLSTALIGIVGLQWLSQHETYPTTVSPEIKLGLINMRIDGLRRWKVHAIFAGLPILIQAALVLFFVGLVDFVWSINDRVVIPVTILVGATLAFLILTTIAPTIQIFPIKYPYLQRNEEVPVQCSYKSPQANAFRRLVFSTEIGFILCAIIYVSSVYIAGLVRCCYHQLVAFLSPFVGVLQKFWMKLEHEWRYRKHGSFSINFNVPVIDILVWPLGPLARKSIKNYHAVNFGCIQSKGILG